MGAYGFASFLYARPLCVSFTCMRIILTSPVWASFLLLCPGAFPFSLWCIFSPCWCLSFLPVVRFLCVGAFLSVYVRFFSLYDCVSFLCRCFSFLCGCVCFPCVGAFPFCVGAFPICWGCVSFPCVMRFLCVGAFPFCVEIFLFVWVRYFSPIGVFPVWVRFFSQFCTSPLCFLVPLVTGVFMCAFSSLCVSAFPWRL